MGELRENNKRGDGMSLLFGLFGPLLRVRVLVVFVVFFALNFLK